MVQTVYILGDEVLDHGGILESGEGIVGCVRESIPDGFVPKVRA